MTLTYKLIYISGHFYSIIYYTIALYYFGSGILEKAS